MAGQHVLPGLRKRSAVEWAMQTVGEATAINPAGRRVEGVEQHALLHGREFVDVFNCLSSVAWQGREQSFQLLVAGACCGETRAVAVTRGRQHLRRSVVWRTGGRQRCDGLVLE